MGSFHLILNVLIIPEVGYYRVIQQKILNSQILFHFDY